MTKLLEKEAKFKWSPQCEEAFLTLKKLLTTAPVLAQPDIEKPFDVYCDASGMGIGGVLMQDGHAVVYASRQLRRHEDYYSTHDLELLAIVHTLKVWRHYLLDNLVYIYTDHKRLKYLFTQPDLNMRQRRWLELIKDYELEVHYHPRYIGPYPIVDKYGPTSYQVELPKRLLGVHNVFHVSQLKRCLKPPADVVIEDTIPLELDLTYKAHPIKVLDQQD
jgi:hypothetical protein